MAFVAWSSNSEPTSASLMNLTMDVMTPSQSHSRWYVYLLHTRGRGRLMWINGLRCAAGQKRPMVPLRMRSASAMRLHSYRDASHSRHFDLIGGGRHSLSHYLVSATASCISV